MFAFPTRLWHPQGQGLNLYHPFIYLKPATGPYTKRHLSLYNTPASLHGAQASHEGVQLKETQWCMHLESNPLTGIYFISRSECYWRFSKTNKHVFQCIYWKSKRQAQLPSIGSLCKCWKTTSTRLAKPQTRNSVQVSAGHRKDWSVPLTLAEETGMESDSTLSFTETRYEHFHL